MHVVGGGLDSLKIVLNLYKCGCAFLDTTSLLEYDYAFANEQANIDC